MLVDGEGDGDGEGDEGDGEGDGPGEAVEIELQDTIGNSRFTIVGFLSRKHHGPGT